MKRGDFVKIVRSRLTESHKHLMNYEFVFIKAYRRGAMTFAFLRIVLPDGKLGERVDMNIDNVVRSDMLTSVFALRKFARERTKQYKKSNFGHKSCIDITGKKWTVRYAILEGYMPARDDDHCEEGLSSSTAWADCLSGPNQYVNDTISDLSYCRPGKTYGFAVMLGILVDGYWFEENRSSIVKFRL